MGAWIILVVVGSNGRGGISFMTLLFGVVHGMLHFTIPVDYVEDNTNEDAFTQGEERMVKLINFMFCLLECV